MNLPWATHRITAGVETEFRLHVAIDLISNSGVKQALKKSRIYVNKRRETLQMVIICYTTWQSELFQDEISRFSKDFFDLLPELSYISVHLSQGGRQSIVSEKFREFKKVKLWPEV